MLKLDRLTIRKGGFILTADFEVRAERICAVMGPSGSGKSTLLGAVAGFEDVQKGAIFWNEERISDRPPDKRPSSILFQDGNLFPHLSLWQNVGLGLRPSLRLAPAERGRVDAALLRVGLGDLGDRRPAAVSGGQQSRAALARLLVQDRPLMLLDEPFAALGPAMKAEMLDLVAEISGEARATVLMVTHDPADAMRIADDIIVVDDGRAAAPQPARALLADPHGPLRAYLGSR